MMLGYWNFCARCCYNSAILLLSYFCHVVNINIYFRWL